MTTLNHIVRLDSGGRGAAIRLDDSLASDGEALVEAFTPTQSSIAILTHLQKAALANAQQQDRAMIWHGAYGSGKSHLGVLVGHLLRNGVGSGAMQRFMERLSNQGQTKLCDQIKTTFQPLGDPDARPYLLVILYGSAQAPSLQHALLEGLYRALRDTPGLDPRTIIPKTEFAAALERLAVILEHRPEHRGQPLGHWQVHGAAFNLEELEDQLRGYVPEALATFRQWHLKVSAGSPFDPQSAGAKGVTQAFQEASAVLTRDHGYNGIAVIWDEFGYALEDLINQPERNPVAEIFSLQDFVETVCTPATGHTLFIGLTHRSLREYGASTRAAADVKNRLETIEGRFGGFSVALKPSEREGYHLLSALVAPTDQGLLLLEQSRPRATALAAVCVRMPVFATLTADIERIVTDCYPLHPVTAAALFAIAAHGIYAQANRTVFTFFRDLEVATTGAAMGRTADSQALYGSELIRLPELLKVYQHEVFQDYPLYADAFRNAEAKVAQGYPESAAAKQAILAVLLLAQVLGKQFQPTESFLAAALYDSETVPLALKQELEALRHVGLIWPRDTEIPVWELESEGGTQIEPLIAQELEQIPLKTVAGYLQSYDEVRQDLLPQCGIHDLDPSPAGIIRSFEVRVLADLPHSPPPRASDERLSALVLFLALEDARQVAPAITCCEEIQAPTVLTYVWIPSRGLADLVEPLRRYLAIARLLQQQAAGEGVARRLRNESEKARRLLRTGIKERLGRIALERGEVTIRRLGDPDARISVTSWHGFSEYLTGQVQAQYPKEVKVRTMNVNRLYNPENYKIKRTEKLLQGILHFDDQAAQLRTDLFGENEGSEVAALIDGTLGRYSNGLLIERADGWDLKTPAEAQGAVGELLTLIHDTLLDRRRRVCELAELRAKLIAPPFGLPTAVMSVFTAVAIRKDANRLKWVNQTGAFASLLWDAFTKGSTLKLRFDTFRPGQVEVLNALHLVLPMKLPLAADREDRARETVSGLRSYYKGLADAVKESPKLSDAARGLFQKLKQPGLDAQDVADCLLDLTKGATDGEETRARLQELIDGIEAVKDERAAEIRQVIRPFLKDPESKRRIIDHIRGQGKVDLAQALERFDPGDAQTLSRVVLILARKDLDQCSDFEIGRVSADLRWLLEQAGQPEPTPTSDPPSPGSAEPGATPETPKNTSTAPQPGHGQGTEETFKQELSTLIDRYQVSLDANRLRAILANYLEGLGRPAAADSPMG